jgi:hypothetical protein
MYPARSGARDSRPVPARTVRREVSTPDTPGNAPATRPWRGHKHQASNSAGVMAAVHRARVLEPIAYPFQRPIGGRGQACPLLNTRREALGLRCKCRLMADEPNDESKLKAEALVPQVSADAGQAVTESRALLVTALSEDLQARSDHDAVDESRLAKVETQTRGLAEAVIAIANPAVTVASVQAVKDEMSEPLATARNRIVE